MSEKTTVTVYHPDVSLHVSQEIDKALLERHKAVGWLDRKPKGFDTQPDAAE